MNKLIFSGHEKFRCKTNWLKRGYDFVCNDRNVNADDAVVLFGVGKDNIEKQNTLLPPLNLN